MRKGKKCGWMHVSGRLERFVSISGLQFGEASYQFLHVGATINAISMAGPWRLRRNTTWQLVK